MEYESIEKLGEIEWLQHRPETYIGTTNNPTHLFQEVLDNALDEVGVGASEVIIDINNDVCTIKDNGRGFPVGLDKDGTPFPIRACTEFYTSGKFNKKVKAYKTSAGLNGIGLVTVSALSDWFKLISFRDGYKHEYHFKANFKTNKVTYVILDKVKEDGKGTIISFKPSKSIFRSLNYDMEYIKDRLKLAKLLTNATIKLSFNGKEIDIEATKGQVLETFFDVPENTNTHSFQIKSKDEIYNVSFFFDFDKNEPRFKGSVNYLPISEGTHVKYFKSIFPNILKEAMPKNKTLTTSDYMVGIRCFIETMICEPKFSGQVKLKLDIDIELFNVFTKEFTEKLNNIIKNEIDLKALYARFIDYKQSLALKKAKSKTKRRKFSASLLDCINSGLGTSLYIVEGDSAAGSLTKCRDTKKHAVFTLFGKSMPNVERASKTKILSNKTVIDLFNILSKDQTLEVKDDISDIKYEKIMITTDPDIDGFHIAIMIMKFFNRFFPKIIEAGRLLLPQIPLYGYYDAKKFIPLYDLNEAKKLLESGKKLMRHKGLGEFDPDELEIILFKNNFCIKVTPEMAKEVKEISTLNESIKKVEKVDIQNTNHKTVKNDITIKDETETNPVDLLDMLL